MPEPGIQDVRAIEVVVRHGGDEDETLVERLGWAIELPGLEPKWVAYSTKDFPSGSEHFAGIHGTAAEAFKAIVEKESS